MQTAITARHFELTPQMKEFVTKKIQKLERYSHYILSAEVILAKDRAFEVVEGKVLLKHEALTAKVQAKDIYDAVTEMVDRLAIQLKRHDERMKDRKKTVTRGPKP